jgi:anti-anti-sigma factor
MAENPALEVEKQGGAVIVHLLVKDLDETHITQVRSELEPVIASSDGLPLVIDMSRIKFVPSLTLGVLVKLANEARARNQKLILASLSPAIRQVFTITRLDKLFAIQDTPEAAVRSLAETTQA